MSGLDVATARLVPLAGSTGWVARVDHAVCFAAAAEEAQVADLFEACAGGQSSAEVLGRVVARLSRAPATVWPAFALVTSAEGEVVVLVHGETSVTVERSDGPELHLSADAPGMWMTRAAAGVVRVVLGGGGVDPIIEGPTDLRAGILAASGAVLIAGPRSEGFGEPAAEAGADPSGAEIRESVNRESVNRESVNRESEQVLGPVAVFGPAGEQATMVDVPADLDVTGRDDDLTDDLDDDDLADHDLADDDLDDDHADDPGYGRPSDAADRAGADPTIVEYDPASRGDVVGSGYDPLEVPGFVATSDRGTDLPRSDLPTSTVMGAPDGGSGVTVTGRYCGRHHFNAPRDRWCRVCGQPLGQDPEGEVEDERPPLGSLVWDNGESELLKRDTVVGRDPSAEAGVLAGSVDAMSPTGQSEGMSRVHAELRLIGWEILLADRGSTNGTFVWDETRQEWHRLDSGERCPLHIGSIVAFGERTATFEALPAAD